MYRVVAVDLDGTMLRSDSTMSPRTISVLNKCALNGAKVVVATGRAPCTAALVIPPDFPQAAWAYFNGSEVYENGRRIAQNALKPGLAKEIVQAILTISPKTLVYAGIGDQLYANQPMNSTVPHFIVDLCAVMDKPVAKVAFDRSRIEDVDMLRSSLPSGCRLIITSGARLGEIMTTTATKAWALEFLVGRWGLSMSDVIAFGDETNDVEMIQKAGFGVAMANAHPEVLAVADKIAPLNDQDGVAQILESLLP